MRAKARGKDLLHPLGLMGQGLLTRHGVSGRLHRIPANPHNHPLGINIFTVQIREVRDLIKVTQLQRVKTRCFLSAWLIGVSPHNSP